MNIKVHSAEMNQVMKVIVQCIDKRSISSRSNIRITHEDNRLTMYATNGQFMAAMSIPVLGGDGESFCVDGRMFERVCAMQSGEIGIITNGKNCMVSGVGRTRIPIVEAQFEPIEDVDGKTVKMRPDDFIKGYNAVSYALATDQSRIQLTGVLMESVQGTMRMVALDGFQLSVEETECDGDDIKVIVPGEFMKLISQAASGTDELSFSTDGHSIVVEADGMKMRSALLSGEFIDYKRIVPNGCKTKCRVNIAQFKSTLRAGNVVENKQNLIRLSVGEDGITIRNNSEQADYEAAIPCDMQGEELTIAFNQRYLTNMINAIDTDDADMEFSGSTAPAVIRTGNGIGCRLTLPVRIG